MESSIKLKKKITYKPIVILAINRLDPLLNALG